MSHRLPPDEISTAGAPLMLDDAKRKQLIDSLMHLSPPDLVSIGDAALAMAVDASIPGNDVADRAIEAARCFVEVIEAISPESPPSP